MGKAKFTILILATLSMVATSCSNGTKKSSEASDRHSQWVKSLSDSLDAVRQESSDNMRLIESLDSIAQNLSTRFSKTNNPKLVENYIIAKEFINYDTESHSGLIARITESNELELIATLRGGTFSAIEITNGNEYCKSAVVPYDKALNFRTSSANIVAFKGCEADSIGQFIANHSQKTIKLNFFSGNSKQSSIVIAEAQKEMIALTWKYIDAIRGKQQAERRSILLTEKAKIIETRINQDN